MLLSTYYQHRIAYFAPDSSALGLDDALSPGYPGGCVPSLTRFPSYRCSRYGTPVVPIVCCLTTTNFFSGSWVTTSPFISDSPVPACAGPKISLSSSICLIDQFSLYQKGYYQHFNFSYLNYFFIFF